MNHSIKKLYDYVQKLIYGVECERHILEQKLKRKEIGKIIYKQKIEKTENELYLLHFISDEAKSNWQGQIFNQFTSLCDLLESEEFSPKDCINIIIFIMRNNIKWGEEFSTVAINMDEVEMHNFKAMTRSEVREFVNSRRFINILQQEIDDVTEQEVEVLKEFAENTDKFVINCEEHIRKYKLVIERFENMRTKNDVELLIEALILNNVQPLIIAKITPYLEQLAKENDLKLKSKEITLSSPTKKEKTKYLTEKEVRDLKKFIRQFFDLYKVNLISIPCLTDLITCLANLETLESDSNEIKRFLSMNLDEILKLESYLSSYVELITLVHYLIKYKIEEEKIDELIKKYKYLKEHDSDPVTEATNYMEEFSYYDEDTASDIRDLMEEINNSDNEEYINSVKEMIREYLELFKKFDDNTEYEKALAKGGLPC